MSPFQVVVAAARKALLEAEDHEKVADALRRIAEQLDEAAADAKRVTQYKEELRAAREVITALRDQLESIGIEPDESFKAID